MIRLTMTAVALAVAGSALAKLPPPDEAAKAKAAETAAKSAWQGKLDAFQLCKVQDRIAAKYRKAGAPSTAAAPAAAGMMPTVATAAAPVTGAAPMTAAAPGTAPAKPAVAAAPATAAASGTAAAKPPTPTAASASQGGGTPVAVVAAANPPPVPPCAEPGPFAYAPPEQKPLEASGAHSPAANASSPPSVRAESGSMTSGKTGGTPKQ